MPEIGREFKALSELLHMDGTLDAWRVLDSTAPDGVRKRDVSDDHAAASELALPASVPADIRGYFDAARMLWVYGFYYYPFYTWAGFHAGICAEMGLARRFADANPPLPKNQESFQGMLHEAIARGWFRASGFTRIRRRGERALAWVATGQLSEEELLADLEATVADQLHGLRKLRNSHAHPEAFSFGMPNGGYVLLEFTRDMLLQLYPAS